MARNILDSPWPYFVGAGVLLAAMIATQVEIRPPDIYRGELSDLVELREREDLNLVFVLVDTLRADRLGIYGYERPTSPNLDELARGGIVFDNAVAQSSWTKTSMASLWTATRPINNGILHYDHVIPEEATLPAEILRDAGYRTAGIWRNGWVAPNFGFGQGFDTYVRPRIGREQARLRRSNPSSGGLKGTDEDILISTRGFLDAFGRERFFLYLHFMDLHQYLYDEGAVSFGTSYSDVYDQSINWTDRLIAALFEEFAERQLLKRTIFVIASDHGEAFQEHGFEGHARNLYAEVTRVPLIIIPPFRLEPGIRVETLVSNMDLWPTVLDLMGLPAMPGVDGTSLVPLVLAAAGHAPAPSIEGLERPAFAQINQRWGKRSREPNPVIGVSYGDYQLFRPVLNPERSEFYDRSTDPGEHNNLYASDPERVAVLDALADEYVNSAASPWGRTPETIELNEMQLGQLRALGYMVDE